MSILFLEQLKEKDYEIAYKIENDDYFDSLDKTGLITLLNPGLTTLL